MSDHSAAVGGRMDQPGPGTIGAQDLEPLQASEVFPRSLYCERTDGKSRFAIQHSHHAAPSGAVEVALLTFPVF